MVCLTLTHLTVGTQVQIPKAQSVFNEKGVVQDEAEAERWVEYGSRAWSQLEWWGTAAKRHRFLVDPKAGAPPLLKDPSQRNAP